MEAGATLGGKYRLLRKLGEGAMGVVWEAVNARTDRHVALKLIPQRAAGDELRSRLLREARACGRISNRHVVEMYDVGQTDEGEPFLVMQLLSGETLANRLTRVGVLPVRQAVSIALSIARGLSAAHAVGVVHRDLKPANVFIHREGDGEVEEIVKVVDFGVSKVTLPDEATMTVTGSAIGSPAYMSPEQARGLSGLDARTDVWALGVVLYQMLAGRLPFGGATPYAVVGEILHGDIPRLSAAVPAIDPLIDDLIARCLERDRDRRVASVADAGAVLERVLRSDSVELVAAPRSAAAQSPIVALSDDARVGFASTIGVDVAAPAATIELTRADFAMGGEPADDAIGTSTTPMMRAVGPLAETEPAAPRTPKRPFVFVALASAAIGAAIVGVIASSSAPPPAPAITPASSPAPLAVPQAASPTGEPSHEPPAASAKKVAPSTTVSTTSPKPKPPASKLTALPKPTTKPIATSKPGIPESPG